MAPSSTTSGREPEAKVSPHVHMYTWAWGQRSDLEAFFCVICVCAFVGGLLLRKKGRSNCKKDLLCGFAWGGQVQLTV